MTRLTTRKLFIYSVLATGTFILLRTLLPFGVMTELLNGVFLGMTGAVCIVFAPLFWRAVRDRAFDRVTQLTFGIILNMAALFLMRGVSVASRTFGSDAVRDTLWPALAVYLAILGATLHITAPGMVDEQLRYNRSILLVALLVGFAIAFCTVLIQSRGFPLV